MIRGTRIWLAGLLLLAVPLGGAVADDGKIKIGFMTTLSGPLAEIGKRHLDGFQLALERAGNKIAGKPVEVIIADDKGNPQAALEATRRLLDSDKVNFVTGPFNSAMVMTTFKPVTEAKTIFISGFSGPAVIAGAMCSPYFFATGVQNDQPYEAMGMHLTKQGDIKSVAIMAPNYVGGRDALNGFKRYYKGEVRAELYPPLNQPDFSAEIAQIRSAKPEGVFFFLPGPMAITFMRQFADSRLRIPTFSSSSIDELNIGAMGEAASGAFLSTMYSSDVDNAANKAFVSAFQEKFKTVPSFFSALGYDIVTFIETAVVGAKGKLDDVDAMRAALRTAKYNLVRGPFRFNTNQFPIQNYYLVQAKPANGGVHLTKVGTIVEGHVDSYADQCPMK